jgi:steroid 5-alpha reductase family enzyme
MQVLFVHKYSGSTGLDDAVLISASYAAQVGFLLYSQLLYAGIEAPFPNLKWLGVALFLIGVTGNAYHHWMLSHLRKDGNKKYVVPQGCLFDRLVCPHYVFEMIDYLGIALISQTLFSCCMVWFTVTYLTGRTIHTKQWYMKKVEGFPEDRSVLIPGIF